MLTIETARKLRPGDILIDERGKRWKVSGKVKTWKRPVNAHRIYIPLKHGLYTHDGLNETDFPHGECEYLTPDEYTQHRLDKLDG